MNPSALNNIVSSSTSSQLAAYVKAILMAQYKDVKAKLDKSAETACNSSYAGDQANTNEIDNSTLGALVKACYKRNKQKLRTIIINYNYDDLFEHLLKIKHPEINIRSHVIV